MEHTPAAQARQVYLKKLRKIVLLEQFYDTEMGQAVLSDAVEFCVSGMEEVLRQVMSAEKTPEEIYLKLQAIAARRSFINNIEGQLSRKKDLIVAIQKIH